MEKTYTPDQVKAMLSESMQKFSDGMIELIVECARHKSYKNLSGEAALLAVAERLKELQRKNAY